MRWSSGRQRVRGCAGLAGARGGRAGLTTRQLQERDSGGTGAVQPRLSVRFGFQEVALGGT